MLVVEEPVFEVVHLDDRDSWSARSYQIYRDAADEAGVPLLGLVERFRSRREEFLFVDAGAHLTAHGYALVAEAIAEALALDGTAPSTLDAGASM